MDWQLNQRAYRLAENLTQAADELRIAAVDVPGGGRVLDFGIEAEGGLGAGLALAQVCTAGLAEISVVPGEVAGHGAGRWADHWADRWPGHPRTVSPGGATSPASTIATMRRSAGWTTPAGATWASPGRSGTAA